MNADWNTTIFESKTTNFGKKSSEISLLLRVSFRMLRAGLSYDLLHTANSSIVIQRNFTGAGTRIAGPFMKGIDSLQKDWFLE